VAEAQSLSVSLGSTSLWSVCFSPSFSRLRVLPTASSSPIGPWVPSGRGSPWPLGLGLIDPPVEQALQTLRRVRNGFAHSTTTATLTDPGHADRMFQAYAAARVNSLWLPLERILQQQVGGPDEPPVDAALLDYILLITILVAFLEAAAQQLSPQPPAVVMGFAGIRKPHQDCQEPT
jgi:hypothetical protein